MSVVVPDRSAGALARYDRVGGTDQDGPGGLVRLKVIVIVVLEIINCDRNFASEAFEVCLSSFMLHTRGECCDYRVDSLCSVCG